MDYRIQREPIIHVVKTLAEYLPHNSRILDLGAADGRHARYLAERGHQVVAIDKDKQAINILEQLAKKNSITPLHLDMTDIDLLPDEQYNAVIATCVLQAIRPDQARELAKYIAEHTLPAGYLAATFFLGRYRTLMENVRPTFAQWKTIETKRTRIDARPDGLFEMIGALLQKPGK